MAARREHQHGDEQGRGPKLPQHREAILAGKHHVQNNHIEMGSFRQKRVQRSFAGFHHFDAEAFRFQVEAQTFGQRSLVFHHQNSTHDFSGNCTTNVLPLPGPALSAQAFPPCRWATERTMNRPRPVPFTRVANVPGAR